MECSSNITFPNDTNCEREDILFSSKYYVLCFRLCEGLIVTSFTKYEEKKRLFEKRLSKSLEQYKNYKNIINLDDKFNGIVHIVHLNFCKINMFTHRSQYGDEA